MGVASAVAKERLVAMVALWCVEEEGAWWCIKKEKSLSLPPRLMELQREIVTSLTCHA